MNNNNNNNHLIFRLLFTFLIFILLFLFVQCNSIKSELNDERNNNEIKKHSFDNPFWKHFINDNEKEKNEEENDFSSLIRLKTTTIDTRTSPQFNIDQWKIWRQNILHKILYFSNNKKNENNNNFNENNNILEKLKHFSSSRSSSSFDRDHHHLLQQYRRIIEHQNEPLIMIKLENSQVRSQLQHRFGMKFTPQQYIPNLTYIARVPLSDVEQIRNVEGVEWIGHFGPDYKSMIHLHSQREISKNNNYNNNFENQKNQKNIKNNDIENNNNNNNNKVQDYYNLMTEDERMEFIEKENMKKYSQKDEKNHRYIELYATLLLGKEDADYHGMVKAWQLLFEENYISDIQFKTISHNSKKILIRIPSFKIIQSKYNNNNNNKDNKDNNNNNNNNKFQEYYRFIIEFLKHQESVLWIEPKLFSKVHNQYSNAIIQNGINENPDAVSSDNPPHPIWDQGLRGKRQLIGIGDTGIDWDNCFFNDDQVDVPINTVSEEHRKIAAYFTVDVDGIESDSEDELNGHGTHVSGTAAGNATSNQDLAEWNGIAPESRIVFTDLQGSTGGLLIPDDLDLNYFPQRYDAGARIDSNSWGCSFTSLWECRFDCECFWRTEEFGGEIGERVPSEFCQDNFGADCCHVCNLYNTQSAEVDQFTFDHDDFLVLFAAGNDGDIASSNTVSSPSTAKNCLSIGASNTAKNNFDVTWRYRDYQTNINSFAIIQQEGITSTDECCAFESSDSGLESTIKSLCCPSYVRDERYSNEDRYNPQNIASFSSRGPTQDGRQKPEIVAPGQVVHSSRSDGSTSSFQCSLETPSGTNDGTLIALSGTSMATPAAAGAAALVRQYFTDGYYPSGSATPQDGIDRPSGALLKAMLIHGAEGASRTLRGDGDVIDDLGEHPNIYEGYGVLSLASALRFRNSDFALYVNEKENDEQRTLSDGQAHTYSFRIDQDSTVKITLTWYDPPASPVSSEVMTNIVDLSYTINNDSMDTQRGNYRTNDNSKHLETRVESGSTVVVRIYGYRIIEEPQRYSLVVTADSMETPPEINSDANPPNEDPQPDAASKIVFLSYVDSSAILFFTSIIITTIIIVF